MTHESSSSGLVGAARSVWRGITPQSLRRYGQPLARILARRRVLDALRSGDLDFSVGPLIVSGLLAEAKGVSEAARLTVAAFRTTGISTFAHDLRSVFDSTRTRNSTIPIKGAGGVWVLHVNAPEGIAALAATSPATWRGRYRIGYWAYELPVLPQDWVKASAAFHEIWTPSRFVADAAAAAGVKMPLRVMPHPVSLGVARGQRSRAKFGFPEKELVVLAMGDLLSSAARKNLVGAIRIYRAAFPEAGRARLVVKTQSGKEHPTFERLARTVAEGRSDISFVSETMSQDDVRGLLASSDILLSPHRAEGFGLPLAESFLAGIPALATGWSGNLEFMSGLSELLIDHTMVPVDDPYKIYKGSSLEWAEPDLRDAATKLRTLAASPDLRQRLANRGRQLVEKLAENWSEESLKSMAWWRLVSQE